MAAAMRHPALIRPPTHTFPAHHSSACSFDGDRRSCRISLERRNSRRQGKRTGTRRRTATASPTTAATAAVSKGGSGSGNGTADEKPGSHSSGSGSTTQMPSAHGGSPTATSSDEDAAVGAAASQAGAAWQRGQAQEQPAASPISAYWVHNLQQPPPLQQQQQPASAHSPHSLFAQLQQQAQQQQQQQQLGTASAAPAPAAHATAGAGSQGGPELLLVPIGDMPGPLTPHEVDDLLAMDTGG